MATLSDIKVRDARDQLVELLGIGKPYPLQDLVVGPTEQMVAFETMAKISIDDSQAGVLYQVHYQKKAVTHTATGNEGEGVSIEAMGTGATLDLETYKLKQDRLFEIYAKKQSSGNVAYLHQTADVKVGLDAKLSASIVDAPFLDPTSVDPTAPRIIDYSKTVQIELKNSQEGVDYRLVSVKRTAGGTLQEVMPLSSVDVRGTLHNIRLTTPHLFHEDTDIGIRATKNFDPSEHLEPKTTLLDIVLPLKVRANMAPKVSLVAAIIDYKKTATIKIQDPQPDTTYQLYIRSIPDRDFVRTHVTLDEVNIVTVNAASNGDANIVMVRKPILGNIWAPSTDYVASGSAPKSTGGDLWLTSGELTEDSQIIVKATRTHTLPGRTTNQTVSSGVQLQDAALVLVRPDEQIKFIPNKAAEGGWEFRDGQLGVFYYSTFAIEG